MADSPSKKRKFNDATTVELVVGPEEVKFYPHKAPLCETSTFFRATGERGFREAHENRVKLPEDEPDVVEEYLQWTYTRKHAGLDNEQFATPEEGEKELLRAQDLFVFADKISCQELKRQIIVDFFTLKPLSEQTLYTIPDFEGLQKMYKKTMTGSAWRRIAVALRVWGLSDEVDHQVDEIRAMLTECPELAADLLFEHIQKDQSKRKNPFAEGKAEDFFEPVMLEER